MKRVFLPLVDGLKRYGRMRLTVELAHIFVALLAAFAFFVARNALFENTKANHTASRILLYETEALINEREYQDDFLSAVYAEPPSDKPVEYWRSRLQVHTNQDVILSANSVIELTDRLLRWKGVESLSDHSPNGMVARTSLRDDEHKSDFGPIVLAAPSGPMRVQQGNDLVQLRKITTHFSLILGHMHAAWDFAQGGIFGDEESAHEELETWTGYITDAGPHPLFLVTLENWRRQKYMSKSFAQYVRNTLLKRSKMAGPVIEHFYATLHVEEDFLKGLPDY